ncbi:MAG: hypothetical protein KBG33_06820 [Paludibacteraceae bacterium]|nr:hypothetical protein [Paludibacteraceae bacterium]
MYKNKYYIAKKSGFYQDSLLLYGLARLLDLIINAERREKVEIILKDCGLYYEIELENYTINEQDIVKFCSNPRIGFDYIFQESKGGTKMPKHPKTGEKLNLNFIDIQKEWEKLKNQSSENTEKTQAVNPDFSIYALLSHFSIEFLTKEHDAGSTQGGMFTRTFLQIFLNQDKFENFIKAMLIQFSKPTLLDENKFNEIAFPLKIDKDKNIDYFTLSKGHTIFKTTYNQLISPTASKGINSNNLRLTELSGDPNLLIEYLKILGCFEGMFSIGGSADFDDYRIYVCEPKEIYLSMQRMVLKSFKKRFFSNSSIKGDILSILLYSKEIINHTEELQKQIHFGFESIFSPKNYVNGFYVCHFMTIKKSPPKKHAPINLAYLKIPTFIDAKTIEEANDWIEIIDELVTITRSIKGSQKNEEAGDAIQGLDKLRTYISSSRIESFLDFQFWYSQYLMFAFNKKQQDSKWFVKTFRTNTLNKLFKNMNMNEFKISEIISNEGFQKVAYAIRKSTVTLQYTPKDKRKFEIRYGLAQNLQNKSKSAADLAEFIGEFIATFNAETARYVEKTGTVLRANIRDNELTQFYGLLDKYPSTVIGALLASYGFALTEKEATKTDDEISLTIDDTNEE